MLQSRVGGFFIWWGRELKSLCPDRLGRLLASNVVHITLAPGLDMRWSVQRSIGPSARSRQLLDGLWPDIKDDALRHCRVYGAFARVNLNVPMEACLKRQITIPAQALAQAQDIAMNDLEHRTPFDGSNAYLAHRTSRIPAGGWTVEQIVLKRSKIEPAVSDLERAGVFVSAISVTGDVRETEFNLRDGRKPRRSRFERLLLVIAAITAFAFVGLSIVLATMTLNDQSVLIRKIDGQLASVRSKVLMLKKKMKVEQSQRLLARAAVLRKLNQVPPIEVWSELTRLLPKTSWVREFQLSSTELRIIGFASAPQELIARISSSPIFKHARFTAPLTRVANSDQEQFQMQIKIGSRYSPQRQLSRRDSIGKLR